MERLAENSEANSPAAYNEIFLKRAEKGIDDFDIKRWKALLKHFKGGRLVDLGCLDSMVPVIAKKKFPKAECWGIDLANEAIGHMQALYPEVIFEVGDIYKTTFPDGYFSYAVAGEVLEHLERPADFIKEAFRILKPGGILAISTPMEEAIEPGAVDGDRHLWSYAPADIRELTKEHGIPLGLRVIGSQYFPKYIYHFPNMVIWVEKN